MYPTGLVRKNGGSRSSVYGLHCYGICNMCMYVYIYIYIYTEREREREIYCRCSTTYASEVYKQIMAFRPHGLHIT